MRTTFIYSFKKEHCVISKLVGYCMANNSGSQQSLISLNSSPCFHLHRLKIDWLVIEL